MHGLSYEKNGGDLFRKRKAILDHLFSLFVKIKIFENGGVECLNESGC